MIRKPTMGVLPYEDAAEQKTVTGWTCKTCGSFWGNDEHMARWCCAKDLPCDCGGRTEKGWTKCKACRDKADYERYLKKPVGEWDGKQMIYHDYHYFETPDDLAEWADSEGITIEDLRPVLCEPTPVPHFRMSEFLSDVLAEDQDIDGAGIDKIVNDWIAAQGVISWQPGKFRMAVMP